MTVLASREHACIHPDVSHTFYKIEGWQQLNDQTSESNLVKLLPFLKTFGYFYRPFVPLPIGSQYRTRGIEMLSKHVYGYDGLEKSVCHSQDRTGSISMGKICFYNPRNAKTVMAGEKEADHASILLQSKDFHEI
jgi:hypothetical protein